MSDVAEPSFGSYGIAPDRLRFRNRDSSPPGDAWRVDSVPGICGRLQPPLLKSLPRRRSQRPSEAAPKAGVAGRGACRAEPSGVDPPVEFRAADRDGPFRFESTRVDRTGRRPFARRCRPLGIGSPAVRSRSRSV
ncbi:MAG TPA: hypothetical protein DCQ98_15965 [Planctomycetaceae bacterium]|nr:hypothetical protein [Planctomycetaceae bacterium]